jgi:hypothetical protein
MKKILFLLAVAALVMTGCESFKNDNPPAAYWNNLCVNRGRNEEGRNPKSEIRNPKEIRNPNSE